MRSKPLKTLNLILSLSKDEAKPDLNTAFLQVSDPKEKFSKFKMTWHYASGVRGVF